jgi:tripartite-type tricarboxylate transporter receptor subunit TctC
MGLKRTIFWALAALALCVGGPAMAEYPDKPIRIICPYPPGGGSDITARMVADALTRQLGQQVVVENRPGAAGALGTAYMVGSKPDGYTLLWTSVDNYTLGPALKDDLPYSIEDMTFIARLAENGSTFAVNAENVKAQTLDEFVDYMKAHPKQIRYGTGGIGSANHITMELFQQQAGVEMTRVVYQGVAPATTDLLAGRLEIIALTPTAVISHMASGKIKLLTITQSERNPLFPDLPTIGELGYPDATLSVWYGLTGPKGLPDDVQQKLQKAMAGVAADPQVQAIEKKSGLSPALLYGDEMRDLVLKEIAKWKDVASKANMNP